MSPLTDAVRAAGGDAAVASETFGVLTVDVAPERWSEAIAAAAAQGATYLDFLTAYDELDAGFALVAHVATTDAAEHLLLRARLPRDAATVASVTGIFVGAAWHERETHEMYGIDFAGNDDLAPLLLPPGFVGHPLRKDFVLASRVSVPWPGEKDPAESTGKVRRRTLPPGVPADWPTGIVEESS